MPQTPSNLSAGQVAQFNTHADNTNEIIAAAHMNDVQREVVATQQEVLNRAKKSDISDLGNELAGTFVSSGCTLSTNALNATIATGVAYVAGVRFSVAQTTLALPANTTSYLYVDNDGIVKQTTTLATAQAKCYLYSVTMGASAVSSSADNRNIVAPATKGSTANALAARDANGDLTARQLKSSATTGTAPLSVSSTTVVTNLNADSVDGAHVGTGANQLVQRDANSDLSARQLKSTATTGTAPLSVSSTTVVTNLNADMVDGYQAGNGSGAIPVSNGTVNTNLNADMLDGLHSSSFVQNTQAATGDWNNVIDTGFYEGNNLPNACPGNHAWRYCEVIKHTSANNLWIQQIMQDFVGSGVYTRVAQDVGGVRTWSPWYPVSQRNNLRQRMSVKDTNKGLYKVVDHERADGTLYAQSTFSNPDANGNYQTLTMTYYDSAGTTALKSDVWTLTYDADGLITSKVPNF